MRRLAQSEIALLSLVVCVLVLAHAAALPMVLCIADAGHIAVEVFDSSCCSRVVCPSPGIYAGDLDCHGCTDLPIETLSDKDRPRRDDATQLAVFATTALIGPELPLLLRDFAPPPVSTPMPQFGPPSLLRC
ncbi:MAG TPA: hypothetical protein VN428_07095 [Bryobacteraceae bacterium]|nr:hypothetical protein [Bryobacteraceae bacterium]